MIIKNAENLLVEIAEALDKALPDLFNAMIAAGRGPTDAELELFRLAKGKGSDSEWRKYFVKYKEQAKLWGSDQSI